MPPVTHSTILRPWICSVVSAGGECPPWSTELLLGGFGGPLVSDLLLCDLLKGDGERLGGLVGVHGHLGRRELGHALPELAEVGVDLPATFGGKDHQRVL